MSYEKVGLEAIFETSQFRKGMLEYTQMVEKSDLVTDKLADALTQLGADFSTLRGDIDAATSRLRASTPENVKFAQSYQKIIANFQKGRITSKEAVAQLEKLRREMQKAGTTTKESRKKFRLFWTELNSIINVVSNTIRVIARATKAVYDFARAGAEIQKVEYRFDRLTTAMGSSTDAMQKGLKDSTAGLLSQVDQMTLATDLMSLGLARSENQAVRMAGVFSQLGMTTNELVLALTNQSIRRFDQLNVSTYGFKERLAEVKKEGMNVQDTFTEAFLQQAENQLERVGGIADQNIGSFMKFEAAIKDVTQAMKKNAADAAVPFVEWMTEAVTRVPKLRSEMADFELEVRTTSTSYEEYTKQLDENRKANDMLTQAQADVVNQQMGGIKILDASIDSTTVLTKAQWELANLSPELAARQADLNDRIAGYSEAAAEAAEETETLEERTIRLREETEKAREEQQRMADDLERVAAAAREANQEYWGLVEALSAEVSATDLAKASQDKLNEAYENGLIGKEAYNEAMLALGLNYEFITQKGIMYEQAITDVDTALQIGIIPAENYGKAHAIAMGMVEDGTFTMGGFIAALQAAGLGSETSAEALGIMESQMNTLDLNPAIEESGALAGNLAIIGNTPPTRNFQYSVHTSYTQSGSPPNLAYAGSILNGVGFYAEGGEAAGGQPIVVGDGGKPEVFVPGSDGYVFPSIAEFETAFTRALQNSPQGGGVTNNYNLNTRMSEGQSTRVTRNFNLMKIMR